jgi:hypothetical protein
MNSTHPFVNLGHTNAIVTQVVVQGRPAVGAAQQAVAADERLHGSLERGPCRDTAGLRPRLLAAVVRSRVRSAFTAERQNVMRTDDGV